MPPKSDRPTHVDFMIQCGDALRAWALPDEPQSGVQFVARPLPDHRLDYLDYEGPVSGDRGRVTQVDAGTYRILEQDADTLVLSLTGNRLCGTVKLTRYGNDWLVRFTS